MRWVYLSFLALHGCCCPWSNTTEDDAKKIQSTESEAPKIPPSTPSKAPTPLPLATPKIQNSHDLIRNPNIPFGNASSPLRQDELSEEYQIPFFDHGQVITVGPNFRKQPKFFEIYHVRAKGVVDYTEWEDYCKKLAIEDVDSMSVEQIRALAEEKLRELPVSEKFEVAIRDDFTRPIDASLVFAPDPLDLNYVEFAQKPALCATTILHNKTLAEHMIPLLQALSDAIPELGLGTVTLESYDGIINQHFANFGLLSDLGFGIVNFERNGYSYWLKNPKAKEEAGRQRIVVNGEPIELQGYRIEGTEDENTLFGTCGAEDPALYDKVLDYYESKIEFGKLYALDGIKECFKNLFEEAYFGPKQRFICDLFDFQKSLDEDPEALAQFLFRCIRIGLPMVGPESKYYGEQCMVKMHLLSMLPVFQNVDSCETLLELNLNSKNDSKTQRINLMKDCISQVPGSANLPFLLPWYIAKLRLLPKTGIYRCE